MKLEELSIYRSSSSSRSSKQILPSNYIRSSAHHLQHTNQASDDKPLVGKYRVIPLARWYKTQNVMEMIRSLFSLVSFSSMVPTCNWLANPRGMVMSAGLGRKVTGTLYGYKKGFVRFAVQEEPRSEPLLVLELAISTGALVKEMSTGLVRIALECETGSPDRRRLKLLQEPNWTMYCNGKRCGKAISRTCAESDWQLLSIVQTVSAGAGVIPMSSKRLGGAKEKEMEGQLNILNKNGVESELVYMRSRFERVVGNRNSEAYYMMNPDGNSGPELSIFFLRI